jgi:hypothetical protein
MSIVACNRLNMVREREELAASYRERERERQGWGPSAAG